MSTQGERGRELHATIEKYRRLLKYSIETKNRLILLEHVECEYRLDYNEWAQGSNTIRINAPAAAVIEYLEKDVAVFTSKLKDAQSEYLTWSDSED